VEYQNINMIRATISFLASALTAVQVFLMYNGAKGLCLNDGCEIVDSMTNISPLFFNIAGFVFFQILFWLFLRGRYGSEYWHKLARLLLLAGLAAEAVLVFFQHSIAAIFCSYCLVIFAFIVLLNICCGLHQLVRGIVLFTAVLATCFSLQFGRPASDRALSLDSGSMAMVVGKREEIKLYLFFSASCGHCEKVIEAIGAGNICTVRFNPIDKIEKFSLSDAVLFKDYNMQINRSLLQSLSIKEIPVLIATTGDETFVLKGEKRIGEYLEKTCRSRSIDYNGTSKIAPPGYTFLPEIQKQGDDSCSTNNECDNNLPPVAVGQ
jgi:hypothetical protein